MGPESTPDSPNPSEEYERGIEIYLANLPEMLRAEQDARGQYDPQRIQQQQELQEQYGPAQYEQQLAALRQLDPEGAVIRNQLARSVSGDLASGYDLPEAYDTELTNSIRGAQAARGNSLGSGAAGAESAFKGKAALDLYQQHLQNAGNFLGGPTPMGQISQIQGVQPDRTSAYSNPNAGYAGVNMGQMNFQNQLAQFQLAQGQGGGWGGALSGGAQGAAAGGSYGGGWGAVLGGVAGAAGGYFSSLRIKSNVKYVGKSKMGLPIIEFRYIDSPQRYRGTIAEEVKKILPAAVFERDGILAVCYDMIDVKHETLPNL